MGDVYEKAMKPEIPLEEMRSDLANTYSDIEALSDIVDALKVFTTRTGGEDRSAFRMDQVKYAALLAKAEQLRDTIQVRIGHCIRKSL